MNAHARIAAGDVHHRLGQRISREIEGDILVDRFSRGRYATDASIYQIEPVGVLIPKRQEDVEAARAICADEGVSILPRGGGTSQSGQTVGRSLVIDYTKHLNRVLEVDAAAATAWVEPGIPMDELNRQIKSTGLWFPVDVSTSSRATIGGMTGNNSCGTRSIRYGIMRDNVIAIDALLADGTRARFGRLDENTAELQQRSFRALVEALLALGAREGEHIRTTFPEVSRRVGGYLIDGLLPEADGALNLATLLCGSEGTLALSQRIKVKLAPQPKTKALGVCHFPTFRSAMEAAQHIVKLGPVAVEVVDHTLIALARDIAMFKPVMDTYVRGIPQALLLVEFSTGTDGENARRLDALEELMGDLGLPGSVVKVTGSAEQASIWGVRTSGLNIMMSMKSEGKPVSFIEDCAVPLEHLADYTERLTAVFEKHGTTGTWYAHASVGCLHVRPVLNLKLEKDAHTMRKIAEEAFAMVKAYKGAHSGEHGDGLVRSEFHEMMYGRKTVALFEEVKDLFDPKGLLNPGKIVRAPRMNDRTLFRYGPDYRVPEIKTAFDWKPLGYPGAGGGFQGAVEMCNNNGECRKLQGGAMCPSFRVTRNERDVTRGRANSLRLAMSGQLGADALGSDEMLETMKLCVSCKACKRECPTGVDMAKMKVEVLAAANKRRGLSLRDRLIAYMPHYAPYARALAPLMNLRNDIPGLAALTEPLTGLSAQRKLPRWRMRAFDRAGSGGKSASARDAQDPRRRIALFADTFNSNFEPTNLDATRDVLTRLGYEVEVLGAGERRPVCCGRTFLAAGLVDQAKAEAARLLAAAKPHLEAGTRIVGIEPSCLLTLRDEAQVMGLGADADALGRQALMLEELIVADHKAGLLEGAIGALPGRTIHLHTHCHQKAHGVAGPVEQALRLIEGASVKPIDSGCCGMAGSFGYQAETHDTSMAMGELALLPHVRAAPQQDIIAADGFSCRHQIADGASRDAQHVAVILRDALLTARHNSASG